MIKHIWLITLFAILWPPSHTDAMQDKYTYNQAKNYIDLLISNHKLKHPFYSDSVYKTIRQTILFDILNKGDRIDVVNNNTKAFSLKEIDLIWLTELLALQYNEQNLFYIEIED